MSCFVRVVMEEAEVACVSSHGESIHPSSRVSMADF